MFVYTTVFQGRVLRTPGGRHAAPARLQRAKRTAREQRSGASWRLEHIAELKALLRVTITNTVFTTSLPATPPPGKKVISFSLSLTLA